MSEFFIKRLHLLKTDFSYRNTSYVWAPKLALDSQTNVTHSQKAEDNCFFQNKSSNVRICGAPVGKNCSRNILQIESKRKVTKWFVCTLSHLVFSSGRKRLSFDLASKTLYVYMTAERARHTFNPQTVFIFTFLSARVREISVHNVINKDNNFQYGFTRSYPHVARDGTKALLHYKVDCCYA